MALRCAVRGLRLAHVTRQAPALGALRFKSRAPAGAYYAPSHEDAKDASSAASELADTMDGMASEHWPGFRKEYLKPKVARKMIEDRKVYNRTKKYVHNVLNLIEFKRARKLT